MLWSFPIGRVAGTTVRIHVTFVLFLAWLGLDAYFKAGLAEASRTLIFLVAIFGCIVAHEFGHVIVARTFGVATPDITLYPFGGVARLDSIPQRPLQEFLVAVAGPLVNFMIAGGLLVTGATLTSEALLQEQADLGSRLAAANLFLGLFNLLPAFPMDGGRVLRATLAAAVGFERATRLAAIVGHWLAIALALGGIFYNPMLIVIAVVILLAATAEVQATEVRAFAKDRPVASAMMTQFAVLPAGAKVEDAVEIFLRMNQRVIPVVGEAGEFLGIIELGDVVRELHTRPERARSVGDIATRDIPRLSVRGTLEEAFQLLRSNAAPAVAITDQNARISGLVTPETLSEMIMLYEASPSLFDGSTPPRGRGVNSSGRSNVGSVDPRAVSVKQS